MPEHMDTTIISLVPLPPQYGMSEGSEPKALFQRDNTLSLFVQDSFLPAIHDRRIDVKWIFCTFTTSMKVTEETL